MSVILLRTAVRYPISLSADAMQDATYQPPVYDYGVNVVYQGDDVYVDGKRTASATE